VGGIDGEEGLVGESIDARLFFLDEPEPSIAAATALPLLDFRSAPGLDFLLDAGFPTPLLPSSTAELPPTPLIVVAAGAPPFVPCEAFMRTALSLPFWILTARSLSTSRAGSHAQHFQNSGTSPPWTIPKQAA
jgi:hypothetical protein